MGSQPASSWQNRAVPRSTSVEYEQQTQTATQRRMPAPPSRRKPASKTGSVRSVDVENDRSAESVDANGRGKSPFNGLVDLGNRAATFVMRQRQGSQEPESVRPPPQQGNNSNSYDYADEEEQYEQIQKSENRSLANTSRRSRTSISIDNKAYKPTVSEEEEESDNVSDDNRRGRRKKKKSQTGPGMLTNMPQIGYDKRKKRRGGRHGEDDGAEDEQEQEQASEQVRRLFLLKVYC